VCPALLLVGENAPMGPKASRIVAENLVDARLRVVPDCGHRVHVDAADTVIDVMDRWLEEKRP
jgi:pimeloyl-ACP methyl ester carboxylesterase